MEIKYEGQTVRLIPIIRGDNDERGVVAFVVWSAIEDAGDWDQIFFQTPNDPRKGDLFHWLTYLTDETNPITAVIFEDKETNALAGMFWFNCWDPNDKSAQIHLWITPAYRGKGTREMVELATRYGHEVLKIQKLVGISPHAVIRNLAIRCDYKETERREYDINGETRMLYRVEHAKETYHG